jgi:hypothetical protein
MAFTDWHRKNWRHDTYSSYIDPDQVARTKNRGAGFWFGAHEESLKNPLMAVSSISSALYPSYKFAEESG